MQIINMNTLKHITLTVDFEWDNWGSWGPCSELCGDIQGTQARIQNCIAAQFGGVPCPSAQDVTTQTCSTSGTCVGELN